MFEHLESIEAVADYVRTEYRLLGQPQRHGGRTRLALPVAEPGPLIERALELAGPDGLTRKQLRTLFHLIGTRRFERGLNQVEAGGVVLISKERRPNAAGRASMQWVYRWKGLA